MKKLRLLSLVLACCTALIFTACSSSKNDKYYEESAAAPESADMAMEESAEIYTGGGQANNFMKSAQQSANEDTLPIMDNENQPNLKLIWYADLEMETLNYDELVKGLKQTLTKMDGFVESSSQDGGIDVYGNLDKRHSNLTIRIPSAKLDDFLNTVSTLGNVTYQSKRSENITLEYADSEARLEALQVEYDKLLELLEKAENIDSVIALESRLSDVRYEMDGLSSSLRKYDDLIDYSTVTISIYEVEVMTEQPDDSIGSRINLGFKNTFIDAKNASEDFIVWTVVNSPFIIATLVIIFIVVKLVNKVAKKRNFKGLKPNFKDNKDLGYPDMENNSKSSKEENTDQNS